MTAVDVFGYAGLLVALVALIALAMRGVDIIFAALFSSLIVIISNGLPLATALNDYFAFGKLGAFTFAGSFFLLFAAGAMFGRTMGDSQAATSIAQALSAKLGARHALTITVLATGLLTYGGIVVFVVIFAVYPLGIKLIQQANIPKRLFCGALALGAGTFTLTALPGTPSIHNVISSVNLGTSLFAGAGYGLLAGAIMLLVGLWYLERQRVAAAAAGESFVAGPMDSKIVGNDQTLHTPAWGLALLPLVAVIGLIMLPRLFKGSFEPQSLLGQSLMFANSQPLLWPSLALMAGTALALLLFPSVRSKPLQTIGDGTRDSIMPLINTAAVIGFGGVVVQTAGFGAFSQGLLNLDMPPLLSMFLSVSTLSAITGSASGGLQIFMSSMADNYLALGIPVETLHRIATIASGGFDSLPHCGAVVAMLTITGLSHRQAYKDVAVVTVVIPVVATLVCLAIAAAV
ncbi:GntP family permease [Gammaproteobacteria bacterium LSUCC0057]|uniref:GntP family permease n=1 Tax=Gammaproteobacteria bacterium LSUCC0057 TaxID=2559237 RepID=A0A4Y8UNE2_9GAMM|nr:GntP family permease [Gammaproteobacteria bacterium LSUCC0057]